MQGFETGDTIFQMVDASKSVEVWVDLGQHEDPNYGPVYNLYTKMGDKHMVSGQNYLSISRAISDARTVFDLLNDLSGYFELRK